MVSSEFLGTELGMGFRNTSIHAVYKPFPCLPLGD